MGSATQRYFPGGQSRALVKEPRMTTATAAAPGDALHPRARALLARTPPTGAGLAALGIDGVRALYASSRAASKHAPGHDCSVRHLEIPLHGRQLQANLHFPPRTGTWLVPGLVFFHGGGWTTGTLDGCDALCASIAERADCAVLSVGYRQAPEHPFPAAFDDAVGSVLWVAAHGASLGLDTARLAIGGASAGANLAAATALDLRNRAPQLLALQVLFYPVLDLRLLAASHERFADGYALTASALRFFRDLYVPDAQDQGDWRASPLLHADHRGLPPALVVAAGYDPARDDALAYATALTAAGTEASYVCFEREMHGFMTASSLGEADAGISLCAGELRVHLRGRRH